MANNSPSPVVTNGGGSSKKEQNKKMQFWFIIGFFVLVFGGVVYFFMSSSKQEKPTQPTQKQVTLNEAEKQKAVKQYDEKERNSNLSAQKSIEDSLVSQQAPKPPEEFSVNVNGTEVLYIRDASGAQYPLDSADGQRIKSDYQRYAQEQGISTQSSPQLQQQNTMLQAEVDRLNQQIQANTQALDEKIDSAYSHVEEMKQIISEQNSTISHLTNTIKTIQPIHQTPEQLAKEIFGKNSEKVLKSKNNTIVASSIVGDKAFLTDKDGNVSVVRVGDIVQGTSLKVLKIDPVLNEVVVSN